MYRIIKKDLIIFDLDGTLVDSSSDIAWAANKTLKVMGYKELTNETIKNAIGCGVISLLIQLMPSETTKRIDKARDIFLKHYGEHLVVNTVPYSGVEETIGYLRDKNKKTAIVTNKPIGPSKSILNKLNLIHAFDVVLGGDSLKNKKPHPEPIFNVMDALGVGPSETAFVGDSRIDGETGKRAGVLTIGAAYGFRGRKELLDAGCDIIIDHFSELKKIIE